jgi:hypothetical protein
VRVPLQRFGWRNIIDLGDITTGRGAEMLLPVWLPFSGVFKMPTTNIHAAQR